MNEAPTTIAELRIEADPERWADCGFAVEEGLTQIGTTPIRFTGASEEGKGAIAGWTLSGGEAGRWTLKRGCKRAPEADTIAKPTPSVLVIPTSGYKCV